jgi:hypothetical protein
VSYTIPPESPKAVKAAAFGRELVKACGRRHIPLAELERVTGVGHTSLDNYRRGLILPKVEVALSLATALAWPRLGQMIVAYRTFVCARAGCGRTFRNDTGAPRRYCSETCQRIAGNLRLAQRRTRRAGQTGDGRTAEAARRQLRSGLALADERARLVESAIGAMCHDCEPDGLCRTAACALRPFSPLPLEVHGNRRPARTEFAIRSASWTPERRRRQSELTAALHADPDLGPRMHHGLTEAGAAKGRAKAHARTPEQFSQAAKKAQATRRRMRRTKGIEVPA